MKNGLYYAELLPLRQQNGVNAKTSRKRRARGHSLVWGKLIELFVPVISDSQLFLPNISSHFGRWLTAFFYFIKSKNLIKSNYQCCIVSRQKLEKILLQCLIMKTFLTNPRQTHFPPTAYSREINYCVCSQYSIIISHPFKTCLHELGNGDQQAPGWLSTFLALKYGLIKCN